MSLHLLALLERAPRRTLRGIDGPARFLAVARGVVAAVEPRRAPPPADERTLRAHDAAIRRLCETADAVLPARFAAPLADEGALREALAPRAKEIAAALERVRGREQMSLRVLRDPGAPATRVQPRGEGAGRRFLEARRETLVVPALDPLRGALSPLVRDERVDPHDAPMPLIATVHHLIDRGNAESYRFLVEKLLEGGIAPPLAVRGPFPAYAFVTEADR